MSAPHADSKPDPTSWRLVCLAALVLLGLGLAVWRPLSLAEVMSFGDGLASHPAAAPLLIAIQALLLVLALPGTLTLWMVAPFFTPLPATIILTTGSTLGALGAYLLSRRLGRTSTPDSEGGRIRRLLARRSDLSTQLALRLFPGFPHSVVNYTAGALRLPVPTFLLAAVLGLSVKWAVYSTAVHGLVRAGLGHEELRWTAIAPLFVLVFLILVGRALKQRLIPQRDTRPPLSPAR